MERLTKNGFDYCAEYCASSADCGFFKHEVPTPCGDAAIYNRLAEYEDTGLEPEEIDGIKSLAVLGLMRDVKRASAIMDAEQEGRLLVLPCKIGAPVWFVVQDVDDPGRWEICEPQKVTEVGTRGFWISGLLDEPDGTHMFTPWSALGSEAFLSREAAETALKERENDG